MVTVMEAKTENTRMLKWKAEKLTLKNAKIRKTEIKSVHRYYPFQDHTFQEPLRKLNRCPYDGWLRLTYLILKYSKLF